MRGALVLFVAALVLAGGMVAVATHAQKDPLVQYDNTRQP